MNRGKVLVWYARQKLCTTTEEMIDFVQSVQHTDCTGEQVSHIAMIVANKQIDGRVIKTIPLLNGKAILVYNALGETLEEHNAAFERFKQSDKYGKIVEAAALTRQMNESRKGLYLVEFHFIKVRGYRGVREGCPKLKDFSANIYAESAADAYNKAGEQVSKTLPNECTTMNFTYINHTTPSMTSEDCHVEFLGESKEN